MPDDAECLRRYAESRDERAFTDFVRRNVDLVYAAAFRQVGGDAHLAEDVVQKVFVAAAQKAALLGRHPVVAAWLHQTTRYAAIDARRARGRREAREHASDPLLEMSAEPEAPVAWSEVSRELDRMVASLGERDRAAVILRFFGGHSFADIGAQLDLSEGAARMRVDRALEKLRARLARAGITSSATALGALLVEHGAMAAPAGLGSATVAAALGTPAVGGMAAAIGAVHLLMTSAKITLGVATLVTLASLGVALHEYRHARAAEQALVHAAPAQPHSAAPAATAADSASAPARERSKASGSTAPAATPKPAHARGPMAALLDLFENPVMQKLNAIQTKIRLDAEYGALFRSLALSPEQIDQFKNLLVEKQMVGFDSMSVARQQGIDGNSDPRAFFQVVSDAEKTVDTQISALLGADGYNQFQQYQATIPARNTVSLLGQALSYTGTPLTETQTSSVIQLLAQYGTPPLPPGNPFAVLNGDLGVVKLNDEGLAQLRGILAPAQLQALQAKIQQQLQLLQAREHMGRG